MANDLDSEGFEDETLNQLAYFNAGYICDQEFLKSQIYLSLADAEKPTEVEWRLYPQIGVYRQSKEGTFAPIVTWDSFEITEVVEGENEWLYSGHINAFAFETASIKTIIGILKPYAQIAHFGYKFSPLFLEHVKRRIHQVKNLPFYKQTKQFGFTDCWHLPDTERIKVHPGIQKKIYDQMRNVLTRPYTEEVAVKAFQAQYNATTIEFKDIIFAWGLMQAFFFPLKPKTDLVPYIFLCGVGDAGITTIGKHITVKWFDHLPDGDDGVKIDGLNGGISIANVKEYMASINLGLLFDDLSKNWGAVDLKTILKSMTTANSAWSLKDRESEEKVSLIYKISPFFTGNIIPDLFNDPQMLLRGLVLYITKKAEATQAQKYREVLSTIPDGLIGWYIIHKTRDWTREDLLAFYNDMPVFYNETKGQETRARANTIYKLFQLGKYFAKEWFGVDLDLTKLGVLIHETKQVGNGEIYAAIQSQIHFGDLEYDQNLRYVYGPEKILEKKVFDPQEKWITFPVLHHIKQGKDKENGVPGFIYVMNNLHDLKRHLRNMEEMSMRQLSVLLQAFFPHVELLDNVTKKDPLNEENKKRISFRDPIFIPEEDLK